MGLLNFLVLLILLIANDLEETQANDIEVVEEERTAAKISTNSFYRNNLFIFDEGQSCSDISDQHDSDQYILFCSLFPSSSNNKQIFNEFMTISFWGWDQGGSHGKPKGLVKVTSISNEENENILFEINVPQKTHLKNDVSWYHKDFRINVDNITKINVYYYVGEGRLHTLNLRDVWIRPTTESSGIRPSRLCHQIFYPLSVTWTVIFVILFCILLVHISSQQIIPKQSRIGLIFSFFAITWGIMLTSYLDKYPSKRCKDDQFFQAILICFFMGILICFVYTVYLYRPLLENILKMCQKRSRRGHRVVPIMNSLNNPTSFLHNRHRRRHNNFHRSYFNEDSNSTINDDDNQQQIVNFHRNSNNQVFHQVFRHPGSGGDGRDLNKLTPQDVIKMATQNQLNLRNKNLKSSSSVHPAPIYNTSEKTNECSICMTSYSIDRPGIVTKCGHVWCSECVVGICQMQPSTPSTYLAPFSQNGKCPICRSKIDLDEILLFDMIDTKQSAIIHDDDDVTAVIDIEKDHAYQTENHAPTRQ